MNRPKTWQCAVTLAFGAIALIPTDANAASYSLGEAADYNVVVLGDYTMFNTDVQGKLAVGGDLNTHTFGVGERLRGDTHGNTLVVGGDINLSNGKVYGDAVYGGTAKVTDDVGFEYRADDNTIIRRASLSQGTPLNFASLGQNLKDLAQRMANAALGASYTEIIQPIGGGLAKTITGATTSILYEQYGDDVTLATLTGTDPTENVFNVAAGELKTLKKLTFDVPETAKVIINVQGDALDLGGFGFYFGDQDCNPGADRTVHMWCRDRSQNILFNFEQASDLSISEVGWMGSILAPKADIKFNNGHINGTLIAGALSGTGESHLHPFNSDTPTADRPASVPESSGILGLGLLGMGLARFSRRVA
ncbi:MAG: choice-of-anchor A family protein [Cyanobacteria bacterium P01_D01_bin.56]